MQENILCLEQKLINITRSSIRSLINKASVLLILLVAFLGTSFANTHANTQNPNEILNSLSLEQKIGQLFLIQVDALNLERPLDEVNNFQKSGEKFLTPSMLDTIKKFPAGGYVFFAKNFSTPDNLKTFTRDLKNNSDIKPFIAIDEEGGQISRIANSKVFSKIKIPRFKSTKSIGDSKNTKKAFNMAASIAKYLKDYGFNFDFAPVADVNTNPENIVIGDRAFGSTPELVSKMVSAYLDGLHSQGVLGTIKHFPGHGDTKNDTHSGYVAVYKTWDELLNCELIPFKQNLLKTDSVMPAHITLENITREKLPVTLSYEIITGKLRNELGFQKVIITDALNMGAIKDNYSSGEAAVLALEAGNDIILMPYDYAEAFNAVLNAVKSGRISEQRINQSVLRILKLKKGI